MTLQISPIIPKIDTQCMAHYSHIFGVRNKLLLKEFCRKKVLVTVKLSTANGFQYTLIYIFRLPVMLGSFFSMTSMYGLL